MKIAVVGGGIFGVTIAFTLGKTHHVDLIEQNSDILMAGSDVNQCRVYRGYHYPRSSETVSYVLSGETSFCQEFSDAINKEIQHYYCISKNDSLVSGLEFLDFCKTNNLEFEKVELDVINSTNIDLCVKVREYIIDHFKFKNLCLQKLSESNVNLILNQVATSEILSNYDCVVICTYANINNFLKSVPTEQIDYQFELCEKLFVKLPDSFNGKSIVVMDGPFMSIDPVIGTDFFIIGDVIHTVHQRNIGKDYEIEEKYASLINRGIISNPPITNFSKFIKNASKFMPEIVHAKHVGSSFCIKTVLANVDNTDSRPTLVKKINDKIITVFSGKITTCVKAANNVSKIINQML